VKQGQPMCIIDAMTLINEIESDVAGTVVVVFVATGMSVEYGQKLFLIKKSG
jgi:oxaloacetate decarboxylase alpha subunit